MMVPRVERHAATHVQIKRGMVAWAGGAGGTEFFIALAAHPEWGTDHSVWGEVEPADMAVVSAIMDQPRRTERWGSLNVTVLAIPVPFCLVHTAPTT